MIKKYCLLHLICFKANQLKKIQTNDFFIPQAWAVPVNAGLKLTLLFSVICNPAFGQKIRPTLQEVQISASTEENGANANNTISKVSSKITSSGENLEVKSIRSLSEFSQQAPGLYGFGTTPRLTGFSIRGLGNNQFNDGLDSSVGLYVDGVYLARQSYTAFGLFDLESVNVFRGPQGSRKCKPHSHSV
jgi:iron complex outermembrane recepter protein